MNKSPVVLFVYNRPNHTKIVLDALCKNIGAKEHPLYIFADYAKNAKAIPGMQAVRWIIHDTKVVEAFAEVHIIEADKNKGLAPSIISGVSQVVEQYGNVIVLEDDSVPAVDFLKFMQNCLEYYENCDNIWSIGGYSFIENLPEEYPHDIYTMGRTCSYAWATWKNRWDKVDWDVKDYSSFKHSYKLRKAFNKYGNDRAAMLDAQQIGRTSSWAIRFCYAMHKNGMFTVYPRYSRIMNIGQDGSGTNFTRVSQTSAAPSYITKEYISQPCNMKLVNVPENEAVYQLFVRRFNMSGANLLKKHIKNWKFKLKNKIGGRNGNS